MLQIETNFFRFTASLLRRAKNFLILLPSTQLVFDIICQNDLKFDPHMKPTINIDQVHQQKREMKIAEVIVNLSVWRMPDTSGKWRMNLLFQFQETIVDLDLLEEM